MLPVKYTFRLVDRKAISGSNPPVSVKRRFFVPKKSSHGELPNETADSNKRNFLKLAGLIGLGLAATQLLPKKADALVFGGTPAANTVSIKNISNAPINPATEETLSSLSLGLEVNKKSIPLTSSGNVHVPTSGKKIRIYNLKFSLSADMTDVSFRFGSGGTDFEKYLMPRSGGLYGANNQPNYLEGGIDEALYCVINGTGTMQINCDYLEV